MKTSWTNFRGCRVDEGFNTERGVVERGDRVSHLPLVLLGSDKAEIYNSYS